MAILTNSGRAALAIALKNTALHLAWGAGDPAWDTTPVPEQMDAVALVAEIGRRKATATQFVTPDDSGAIVVLNGRFSLSDTPTGYLYCQFDYDYADAPTATIREIAVFSGTVTNPALPPGQMYFLPGDVVDPGMMVVLEHIPLVQRSLNVQQAFRFVIEL